MQSGKVESKQMSLSPETCQVLQTKLFHEDMERVISDGLMCGWHLSNRLYDALSFYDRVFFYVGEELSR